MEDGLEVLDELVDGVLHDDAVVAVLVVLLGHDDRGLGVLAERLQQATLEVRPKATLTVLSAFYINSSNDTTNRISSSSRSTSRTRPRTPPPPTLTTTTTTTTRATTTTTTTAAAAAATATATTATATAATAITM